MAIAVQQVARTVPTGWTFAFPIRRLVRLFHRVGRGIELTETGRLFLVEARSVLARSAAAELALAELGGLRRGTLLVQASQTISSYWLPRHLVAFRRAHPGVELRLQVGNTAQVAAAVHEGAAELGFVEGAVRDPMLTSTTVARDQLIVVVAPGHPWAECRTIECAKLPDSAWVLREPGSGTRSAFEAALEGFGISPGILRVALELPTNEAVRAAVGGRGRGYRNLRIRRGREHRGWVAASGGFQPAGSRFPCAAPRGALSKPRGGCADGGDR